ncbi:ThuA domain-containing protein [Pareuzebyella sediminis]|uniref:ThuA domain-containing protein n=1 Tax=Pareuzebyella sediminis TaxID=2607998 RepID=UPI0011EEC678|nr:ThuA domain-containing protein [Pareuzebyella sediminis]
MYYNLKTVIVFFISTMVWISNFSQADMESSGSKINVLIIDGQNNHVQWPKISYMLKKEMEKTGLFNVDVERSAYTWNGEEFLEKYNIEGIPETEALEKPKEDPNYSPDFKAYDVVICNFGWNAAPWPEKTKEHFEKYMVNGGGLVVFHAADNSFPKWEAYNQMIGLGGWGDRTEKDGPYVYYNEAGEEVRDSAPGSAGSHGPQHEYQIQVRETDHPITKGMPKIWMHTQDELYDRLRGPAKHMKILATAYSDSEKKGTGRHEPALMVIDYGKGRVFHNIMGHADYSIECVGFLTSMLRGIEWAATGKVTQEIPKNFPTAQKSSSWQFDE